MNTPKTILMTGSTGFIGRNLLKRLRTMNYYVYEVSRNQEYCSDSDYKVYYDGKFNNLKFRLSEVKIDFIIHLATRFLSSHEAKDISSLIDSNIKLGTHLLEFAKTNKVIGFLNFSTYAIYSKFNEYSPQNLYAATKRAFEDILAYYIQNTSTVYVTLELFDTYGPGDNRKKFINLLLDAVRNEVEFNMSLGEQEISYIYIEDVVEAIVKTINMIQNRQIVNSNNYSVYNPEKYKLKDLVEKVLKNLGSTINVNRGYYPYRTNEIMVAKPTYDILPNWNPNIPLDRGIHFLLEDYEKSK